MASRPLAAIGAAPAEAVDELVSRLREVTGALTPDELLAADPRGLGGPGLYSWWVDEQGAGDLTRGLGERIEPGLIYAGLAGATRSRSGRRSTNALWGRLHGMHLGSRHEFSTFRRSLGPILAEARGADEIDEAHLTAWMRDHLRVIAVLVADADALDGLKTGVLAELDPPLNVAKLPKTPIRARLKQLRRPHSKKRAGQRSSEPVAPMADEGRSEVPSEDGADALGPAIDQVRQDDAFQALLAHHVDRDAEILQLLAEGPDDDK